MNILKSIFSTLYIPVLIILGTIVGFIVGAIFVVEGIVPWWSKYEIDTEGLKIQEISLVDYDFDYINREPKDILYVKTTEGQFYSYSMVSKSWQFIEPYDDDRIEKLVHSFDGKVIAITDENKILLLDGNQWELLINNEEYPPSRESQSCDKEWLFPPVWQPIKDSEGLISEHTLAFNTYCTILLENGRLQYWYHQLNVFTGLLTIGIFSVLGFIAGSVISFFIRRRLKAKKNEVGEENENHHD